jgi:hypothetical protein
VYGGKNSFTCSWINLLMRKIVILNNIPNYSNVATFSVDFSNYFCVMISPLLAKESRALGFVNFVYITSGPVFLLDLLWFSLRCLCFPN